MTCADLSFSLPVPQIPPILIPSPSFTIVVNPFTFSASAGLPCCNFLCNGKFGIPGFVIVLPTLIPPAVLIPVTTTLNALLIAAWPVLDLLAVLNCPFNTSGGI